MRDIGGCLPRRSGLWDQPPAKRDACSQPCGGPETVRNTGHRPPGLCGTFEPFHATTGTSAGTFASFNSAASGFQANTTYTTAAYTNQYESFAAGQNYVALSISIAAGQSLFVASDGTETELRGFLNMAQIVAIPEPAAALLGALGMLTLLRRRRD